MLALLGSWQPYVFAALMVLFGWWWLRRRRPIRPSEIEPRDLSSALASAFLIKPYLQLGDAAVPSSSESVELHWHMKADKRSWSAQVRPQGDSRWRAAVAVENMLVDIADLGQHSHCKALFDRLPAGTGFSYRLLADGAIAFSGIGKTRNSADQPYSFAVPADIGEPERGHEQQVVARLYDQKPDFVAMPGDIVYNRGRVSEYRKNLFPVYNADVCDPAIGAPLMRSRIIMPCPGNHDLGMPDPKTPRDFSKHADLLGYFLFWSVPLNGSLREPGKPNTPPLIGDEKARYRFAVAAGDRFPRIAMYSFSWGNSHWTVLDSNAYVDWTDAELRAWVAADLAKHQQATWRFVMFHHPAFSSDGKHVKEQRMRLLADLFRRCNVDVVFSGHNHCYERSRPLRFKEDELVTALNTEDCPVAGKLEVDTEYDGAKIIKPKGVIYIGAGASGAKFYPESVPAQVKSYTAVYDQSQHSFTHVQVDGKRLIMRQIGEDGSVIDQIVIEK